MYTVYQISIANLIYYGHTKNEELRIKQHINDCYNSNSKAYNKQFYIEWRKVFKNKNEGSAAFKIAFKVLYEYNKKADAKRREFKLIIDRYFDGKELFQKIPNLSDR